MEIAVILLAFAAIALGCYDIANPYGAGMFGFDFHTTNNGDPTVTRIYPGSPVERAGTAYELLSRETRPAAPEIDLSTLRDLIRAELLALQAPQTQAI